jgi:hypothetical protein
MKKVLTISERGELAEQLQSNEHFYTDIKLYNEFFPGSKLSSQLAKANEHNMPSLHSRMLYDLLSQVDQEDVLENRKPVELQIVEKTDAEKKEELRLNIISQIRVLLKNNISVEKIKETIGNQPVADGEPTLIESEFNDLVDSVVELWISQNPDYVLTIDVDTKVDETNIDETNVDETKVDDTKVDETKVDDTKVDETNVDETKVDDTKVDDTKVDETKVDEVTNVPTTEETKEVAPVVEDEKKSVKKVTNSPK